MSDIFAEISQADEIEIEDIMNAVRRRYAELFPEYDLNILVFQKDADPNAQLDKIIHFLQGLKNSPV